LVTDGVNTAGNVEPVDAARRAAEKHIRIDSVLIGAGTGRVPVLADTQGEMVRIGQAVLPANPELLRRISATTGGEFYQATAEKELRHRFHQILDGLQRSELDDSAAWARSEDLAPALMPWIALVLFLGLTLRFAAPVRS
jgi:Ca-activated chloride channel family protein